MLLNCFITSAVSSYRTRHYAPPVILIYAKDTVLSYAGLKYIKKICVTGRSYRQQMVHPVFFHTHAHTIRHCSSGQLHILIGALSHDGGISHRALFDLMGTPVFSAFSFDLVAISCTTCGTYFLWSLLRDILNCTFTLKYFHVTIVQDVSKESVHLFS